MSATMRRPTARGGILNSSTCMASAPKQILTQEARGRPAWLVSRKSCVAPSLFSKWKCPLFLHLTGCV